jgi:hypothetical protein
MTNTVRIIDKLGLFPETRGKARYVTVKTYAHAMEIVDEQNKLGNIATLINWYFGSSLLSTNEHWLHSEQCVPHER